MNQLNKHWATEETQQKIWTTPVTLNLWPEIVHAQAFYEMNGWYTFHEYPVGEHG